LHPTLPVLYAVSEQEGGALVAFHLGEAEEARAIKTGGSSPCHVAVHPGGAIAAVANYADGSVALVGLDTGGLPADEPLVHRFSGSGPNRERQEGPHAHFVKFIGDELYVVDLGSDRLHRLDLMGNTLGTITFPAGSGPRHFTGGRPGQWFVACELDATVRGYREEPDGTWSETGQAKASDHDGINYPSHIECSSDGSLVYVANRGPNTITVFAAGEQAGLTRVGEVAVQGAWPRHFVLYEGFLYVANQDSNNVVRFRIDDRGLPSDPEQLLNLDSPSCLLPCDDARAVW
jgi:6-phosphogluconolactonase (cycloisomerase 2 family)